MWKQGKLTAGVNVALVKLCRFVIAHIESCLIKSHSNLSLKKPLGCIYAVAQKPKPHHFVTTVTANLDKTRWLLK
jgi:hypothetical protein